MPSKQSLQLLQQLIELDAKKYLTTSEQLAYECGYLTGLLASIMDDDSLVRHTIIDKLKKIKPE
jgi:hypothetical protein